MFSIDDAEFLNVAFAASLKTRVVEAASLTAFSLDEQNIKALDIHIDVLPLDPSGLDVLSCIELDSAGTELWNACSRAMSIGDGEWEQETLVLLVRGVLNYAVYICNFTGTDLVCLLTVKVLSFLMLESARNKGANGGVVSLSKEGGDETSIGLSDVVVIELLKVALNAARLCLGIRTILHPYSGLIYGV